MVAIVFVEFIIPFAKYIAGLPNPPQRRSDWDDSVLS
jgi:hypothetical protein